METIKKLALLVIALLCIVFLISPADLLPGVAVDDIFYIIVAIASCGKIKHMTKETV